MSNEATVKLDFNMQDVVAAAIFEKLDATKRDELVKGALVALLNPQTDYNGRPAASQLQRAFERAVSEQAEKMVRECLSGESPEAVQVRDRIRALVVKAFDNLFRFEPDGSSSPDKIVEKLTDVITAVLTPKERY